MLPPAFRTEVDPLAGSDNLAVHTHLLSTSPLEKFPPPAQ